MYLSTGKSRIVVLFQLSPLSVDFKIKSYLPFNPVNIFNRADIRKIKVNIFEYIIFFCALFPIGIFMEFYSRKLYTLVGKLILKS